MTSCARLYVTADVWEMIKWVDRFEKHGLLPLTGAGMDQTASFVESLDFIPHTQKKMELDLSGK